MQTQKLDLTICFVNDVWILLKICLQDFNSILIPLLVSLSIKKCNFVLLALFQSGKCYVHKSVSIIPSSVTVNEGVASASFFPGRMICFR